MLSDSLHGEQAHLDVVIEKLAVPDSKKLFGIQVNHKNGNARRSPYAAGLEWPFVGRHHRAKSQSRPQDVDIDRR